MVTHSEQTQRRSHKRARQEYRPKSEQLRAAHDSSMVQVRSYISQLLRGEATRHGQIGAPLSASAYIALLPTVWVLSSSSSTGDDVFASLVEHAVRTSSKSAAKRPAVELIAQLVLVSLSPAPFRPLFRADACSPIAREGIRISRSIPNTCYLETDRANRGVVDKPASDALGAWKPERRPY